MWKNRFNLKDGLSKNETLLDIAKYLQMQFILEENLTIYDDTLRPLPGKATIFFINELVKHGIIEFVKPWASHPNDKSTSFCELKSTEKLEEFCLNGILSPCVDSKAKLTLTHKTTGELIINDIFLLHKTDLDSQNDKMLKFLIKNSNKVYTRADLEKKHILNAEKGEDKDFHTFLADIKMKGVLKKLFFGKGLTKNKICLTNPVYQEDFDRVGIKYIDLKKFLKDLLKKKDREQIEDD